MSLPKFFLDEMSGKAARDRKPKKHEKSTAKTLGGKVQPASGAKAGFKGDVREVGTLFNEFLVECKRTEKQSIRIEARWLNKITTEAGSDQEPAIAIQFDPMVLRSLKRPGEAEAEADWIAMPRSVFRRLLSIVSLEEEKWVSEI